MPGNGYQLYNLAFCILGDHTRIIELDLRDLLYTSLLRKQSYLLYNQNMKFLFDCDDTLYDLSWPFKSV